MVRVDDLHIVRRFDIAGSDDTLTLLAQIQHRFISIVQLEHDALEVE